jgi:hypothetical protein
MDAKADAGKKAGISIITVLPSLSPFGKNVDKL